MKNSKPYFVTIINDCRSENDIGRQTTRYSLLFPGVNINFVGVDSDLGTFSTFEASGNLIDVLEASGGQPGVIALNVAPRGRIKEDGENGSRFSYFWYEQTLVVSTIKGYSLSLVKKLGLTESINILETKGVLEYAYKQKLITRSLNNYIGNSQFRSFDFQPRVARWIWDKIEIPSTKFSLNEIADPPGAIWLIDSFGNVKTTISKKDLHPLKDQPLKVNTNLGVFPYYERLKDVPVGETAIYTGSSGLGNNRFLEIATQGVPGSAAKDLNLIVGDEFKILL